MAGSKGTIMWILRLLSICQVWPYWKMWFLPMLNFTPCNYWLCCSLLETSWRLMCMTVSLCRWLKGEGHVQNQFSEQIHFIHEVDSQPNGERLKNNAVIPKELNNLRKKTKLFCSFCLVSLHIDVFLLSNENNWGNYPINYLHPVLIQNFNIFYWSFCGYLLNKLTIWFNKKNSNSNNNLPFKNWWPRR